MSDDNVTSDYLEIIYGHVTFTKVNDDPAFDSAPL